MQKPQVSKYEQMEIDKISKKPSDKNDPKSKLAEKEEKDNEDEEEEEESEWDWYAVL